MNLTPIRRYAWLYKIEDMILDLLYDQAELYHELDFNHVWNLPFTLPYTDWNLSQELEDCVCI